jgi:hypothetical protein
MYALLNQSHSNAPQADITPSYVCSRFYLHDPPGQEDVFLPHPEIPEEALEKERELAEAEPEVNPWACIILLVITVGLMGPTAEFVREISPLVPQAPSPVDFNPSPHSS